MEVKNMPKTYNQYIQEGIENGTFEKIERDGVTLYKVRAPMDGEEVVGYSPSSAVGGKETLTERAEREGAASN
jgi:hypothetical protein